MHFSIDRTVHTTAFDKPVVDHWLERKIARETEILTYIHKHTYIHQYIHVCMYVYMYIYIYIYIYAHGVFNNYLINFVYSYISCLALVGTRNNLTQTGVETL